jgi:hypothetical protein
MTINYDIAEKMIEDQYRICLMNREAEIVTKLIDIDKWLSMFNEHRTREGLAAHFGVSAAFLEHFCEKYKLPLF